MPVPGALVFEGLSPQGAPRQRAVTRPGAVEPSGRRGGPLEQGQTPPAVWSCNRLVFTFSRPGSPDTKVTPD